MEKTTHLEDRGLDIAVDHSTGQLCSLRSGDVEYMHHGKTAWLNTEMVMFPVVGPVRNHRVDVGSLAYALDQHGISRVVPFRVENSDDGSISVVQHYDGSFLENPKGHNLRLNWMPYTLEKRFSIDKDVVSCELIVTNDSVFDMPYMIGWHPAFRVFGDVSFGSLAIDSSTSLTLERLLKEGGVRLVKDVNSVEYVDDEHEGQGMIVASDDLDHAMIWSPGKESGLVCIEFVSHLPSEDRAYFTGDNEILEPGEKKSYTITLEPF